MFPRGNADGQQANEEMLNILTIKERKIKTTTSCHLTPVRMVIIKKNTHKKTNASEDVGKTEPSYTVAGNVNWCGHCGKQYGGFSKKLKIGLLLGIYPKKPLKTLV